MPRKKKGPERPRRPTTARAAALPRLRAKLWVEVGTAAALTDAGADLLEQILVVGSLSEAARRLGFAYRRAWLLVDAMNRLWPHPLVKTAIGGTSGGGTKVTDYGRQVLAIFREMQLRTEHLLGESPEPFSTP